MPNEVVWVDKIINPRSVVLTYNEAMNVLKKAKTVSGRSQFTVAECKPSTSKASVKIEDQKEECLKFLTFDAYEMEEKPIIQMQEELHSINASKITFNEAVNKNIIRADGLPRLKPSLSLKKDIMRSQKDKKKNSVGSNLANIAGSAINKEAVKNLYSENDDAVVLLSSSESEKEDIVEPAVKRKRIVISDDEDIEDNVESSTSSSKQDTIKTVSGTVSQNPNNREIFMQALKSCVEATSDDKITVTFEANNSGIDVIASSSYVNEIINDNDLPTNVMFTDEVVSSFLNLPTTFFKNSDESLRTFWLGETKEQQEKLALIKKQQMKKPNMDLIQKLSYAELVKDEKFCSKLLETVESDIDVTTFLDMDIRKNSKEYDYLPKQNILNSLFSEEDLEMMEYKKEMEKINSNRVREKQRIQHPFVKLKHSSILKSKTIPSNIQKSSISPKSIEIDYGIKGILKKFNSTDATSAQISMKNQLISHNTVIHEALKYLLKNKTTQKTSDEIENAFDKLQKYPLTFLEKFNIVTTMPKNLSGILCLLDDLGLRFGKESLEKLEKDCISLFGTPDKNEVENNEQEEIEKSQYDPESAAKKVRFSKTVEHRFL